MLKRYDRTLKLQQETISQLKQSIDEMKTANRVNVTGRIFETKYQLFGKIGNISQTWQKIRCA